MRNRKMVAFTKRLCMGFIAAVVVLTGIVSMPASYAADGTVVADNGVEYVPYKMEDYWSTTEKKVPEKKGFVFGGWYKAEDVQEKQFTALKEDEIQETDMEGVYAKFVSAYVLSVKSQLDLDTQDKGMERTNNASIRLISSVDSKDYQKVGFKILLPNKTELKNTDGSALESTKIYTGLKVTTDEEETPTKPSDIFGAQSQYLSVWRLDGISKQSSNDTKIFTVTPYWITMDGTKVEGLTKYVHVEDGYMKYISVPINLREAEEIAAGSLTLKYQNGLEFVSIEYNGVFPEAEMAYHDDANGTIKIVGNADTVDKNVIANGIYANLRFKVGTSGYQSGQGRFLEFEVGDEQFCNWNEEMITVDAWDIKY